MDNDAGPVTPGPGTPGGLFGSLRSVIQSAIGLIQTRLEILSTEIGEERYNLTRLVIVALVVLFCFQVGVIFAVLYFVLAVGEANRVAAVGIAALVLLLVALGGVLWLRGWLKSRPPMFGTTIAELRKDLERIGGR